MTKKVLSGICGGLLAIIVAGGVCAAGYASRNDSGKWFRNSDIAKWHWSDKKPGAQAQSWGGAIDNAGNELNSKEPYAMPTSLAFYATTSADVAEQLSLSAPSVTVNCSHNFEFNNLYVDWSVEYPNGVSAADVVTVTPTKDGSLTATLTCHKEFDQQLTLKATLRGDESKTATCTIDYVKRIESFNTIKISCNDFDDPGGIQCQPAFGNGTVNGNWEQCTVIYRILDDFQNAVKKYLNFNISFKSYKVDNISLKDSSYGDKTIYSYDGENWAYDMFIENFNTYDEAHKNAIYYAWYTAARNAYMYSSNVSVDINIKVFYNGNLIQSIAETDYIGSGSNINQLYGEIYGSDLSPDLTLNGNIGV